MYTHANNRNSIIAHSLPVFESLFFLPYPSRNNLTVEWQKKTKKKKPAHYVSLIFSFPSFIFNNIQLFLYLNVNPQFTHFITQNDSSKSRPVRNIICTRTRIIFYRFFFFHTNNILRISQYIARREKKIFFFFA